MYVVGIQMEATFQLEGHSKGPFSISTCHPVNTWKVNIKDNTSVRLDPNIFVMVILTTGMGVQWAVCMGEGVC